MEERRYSSSRSINLDSSEDGEETESVRDGKSK